MAIVVILASMWGNSNAGIRISRMVDYLNVFENQYEYYQCLLYLHIMNLFSFTIFPSRSGLSPATLKDITGRNMFAEEYKRQQDHYQGIQNSGGWTQPLTGPCQFCESTLKICNP